MSGGAILGGARLALVLVVVSLLGGVSARGQSPAPSGPSADQSCVGTEAGTLGEAGAARSPFVRADVRAIADIVTCYCGCPHLQVSKCYCGTADAIRADFAERLDRGEAPEAIIAAYVEEHGGGVLAVPERRGFHWIIWVGPPCLLVIGAVLVWLAGRRWARLAPAPELAAPPLDPEAERRYRESLRRAVEES